jgi:hypothetical protein
MGRTRGLCEQPLRALVEVVREDVLPLAQTAEPPQDPGDALIDRGLDKPGRVVPVVDAARWESLGGWRFSNLWAGGTVVVGASLDCRDACDLPEPHRERRTRHGTGPGEVVEVPVSGSVWVNRLL